MLRTYFLSSFIKLDSAVAEKSKYDSDNQRPGQQSSMTNRIKNTNLVEIVEDFFLSSFVKIHSTVAERKSKNVSVNQRPGRLSWISDRHEKHKLGRGRWELASCQVSSKSIQGLRRSRKMFQLIRDQGGHLGWWIGTKNTNLVEDIEDLLPGKFRQNLLSSFSWKVNDGRTTNNGRRTSRDHNSALEPSAQVH